MEVLKILQILLCVVYITKTDAENAPSVIIIGAGAAGIAAASKLLQNNISNIIILEAEDRIGGRIYSVKFGKSMVDLGAQWCHGESNNIVHELIEKYNLLVSTDMDTIYRYSSGEPVDQNFAAELYKISQFDNTTDAQGLSIGGYLTPKYNEIINKRWAGNKMQLEFATDFLQTIHKRILLIEGAFSWFDPSALSDYEYSDGDQELSWNGHGYKTILNVLMKIYPNPEEKLPVLEKTQLNKRVVKIQWENDISIECSDGSKFTPDHVIVTTSLGVLKHRHTDLFDPKLPEEKVNAIQELGYGAVFKVFLHFPMKWWRDENIQDTAFVWSEQDKSEMLKTISDDDEVGQSWILDLNQVHITENNPNVLETWFGGETIPKIESFSDDKIIDGIMFACEKFLRAAFPNLTRPDYIIRNNWYTNPNFHGTYSYQTVKSREREVSGEVALSQPLFTSNGKKSVLFAGEATHPTHYSTVHGAIETGFREAERIINFYK